MESFRPRRLPEFLGMLWRRRKLLLLMALVMLTATLIVIRRIPNQYESHALIVVNVRSDAESASEMARFSALQQGLSSRETMTALIRKYSLYPKAQDMDEAVLAIQKALKVETKMRVYGSGSPESVSINYRYPDPKIAQAVVTDLVKMLDRGNEQIRVEATAEAGRLTGQISDVENRLRELGPRRDFDLAPLEALSRSRADLAAALTRRQSMESSIESLSDNEYSLQRRIADQRNQLTEHEKTVRSLPAAPGSAAYGTLLAEKSRVEADIQIHSDQYTDKHPKMIQLRNQLSEINRQITRLETQPGSVLPTVLTPEGRELGAMQRDLKRMETELELVQRQLQRKSQEIGGMPSGPAPAVVSGPLTRPAADNASRTEYDRLVLRYNWLLEKQDSMLKLSGAQGPSHMMFYVIDTPNLPRLPILPQRLILQLIALAVAILFGLLIALAVELPRMLRINDDRDVEYFLGAPVLALIPESLTPNERARNRKLRLTRGLLILTLAVALAPILILLLTYSKIFQIVAGN